MRANIRKTKCDETGSIHILLVIRWPAGGIRTFVKYFLRSVRSDRCRFSIIATECDGLTSLRESLDNEVDCWYSIPNDKMLGLNFVKSIARIVKEDEIDIVHAHGFSSSFYCLLGLIFSSAPYIVTSHDVINDSQFSGSLGFFKMIALKLSLGRSKIVHSVSKDAADNLINWFPGICEKSVVIRNGIEPEKFCNSSPISICEDFGIDKSNKVVGFFGRFMSQKGFRYLVEAVDIIINRDVESNIKVVCFGSGEFFREEKRSIEGKGLEANFVFAPFLEDVSGAMKGCDLIAMPSLWEACPLQPMEALCAGVPFVGSDCIGLREVLAGTPAIQVKAGDANSLAKGILECLEIGRQPFEDFAPIAVDRFDIRKSAKEIHALYERVLG
ncbi:glycosyltransferase family 4 protein [Marinobacter sp. HN1S83]|uniref:glycosyltransferase family 4 protein n=1 Tax=Marinobacter sp. HN1S83 TaxID=3382301 RepID=UPI00387B1CD8